MVEVFYTSSERYNKDDFVFFTFYTTLADPANSVPEIANNLNIKIKLICPKRRRLLDTVGNSVKTAYKKFLNFYLKFIASV